MDNSAAKVDETHSERNWSVGIRVCFRFAFCYLGLYVLCNGNISLLSPVDRAFWVTPVFSSWGFKPFALLALELGKAFHLTGVASIWHGGGSGDTALNWITTGILAVLAGVATLIWSILDRKRQSYPLLYAWLRFAVRLMLGVSMISYGIIKVFALQMPPIPIGNLNEPLGQMSPFSLVWAMLRFSPT